MTRRELKRIACYVVAAVCWAGFAMPYYENRPDDWFSKNSRLTVGLPFSPWYEETAQYNRVCSEVRQNVHPVSLSSLSLVFAVAAFSLGYWEYRPTGLELMTVTRRELSFASFDEVIADVERLRAGGYTKEGNWDLSQCCGHLTAWLTYPVSGFPKVPLPIKVMLSVVRPLMGRRMLAKFLEQGMPAGKPTIPASVVPSGDEAAAVESLKAAIRRFRAHDGEYLPSPLFGRLTRDEALTVQLAHAAHHLSFLNPK